MLESPDDIFCFEFCPSDPNIIAGGCINGQVVRNCLQVFIDAVRSFDLGNFRTQRCSMAQGRHVGHIATAVPGLE